MKTDIERYLETLLHEESINGDLAEHDIVFGFLDITARDHGLARGEGLDITGEPVGRYWIEKNDQGAVTVEHVSSVKRMRELQARDDALLERYDEFMASVEY